MHNTYKNQPNICRNITKLVSRAAFAIAFLLSQTSGAAVALEPKPWRDLVDMKLADLAAFKLVLIQNGSAAGSMEYRWRKAGETYIVEDRTEMQPNILETAKATINATSFLPEDIEIDFAIGEASNVFRVAWNGSERLGKVVVTPQSGEARTHDLSGAEVPANPVRLSAFGLALGIPWEPGLAVSLPWYNTMANADEAVVLTHTSIKTVVVPAGEFEVHEIALTGSVTENTLYITTAYPQKMIRIDVSGQPIHFERLP